MIDASMLNIDKFRSLTSFLKSAISDSLSFDKLASVSFKVTFVNSIDSASFTVSPRARLAFCLLSDPFLKPSVVIFWLLLFDSI